jgi:glycosyltransferase involved in cell wall biosynthesis
MVRKKSPKRDYPLVSVVMPCFNAQETLREVLQSIVEQDYPRFEIIAVDDGSTDQTNTILREFSTIHVITQKNAGPAAARNVAFRKAKGDIILIQDADAKVFPGWIAQHVEQHHQGKDVVGGSVIPWNNNFVGMCDHMSTWYEYYPEKAAQKNRYQISSTNLSFSKEVVAKVGLFNEKLRYLEDVEYCQRIHRAGYSIAFAPRVTMAHHDRQTWKKFLLHHYNYGTKAAWIRMKDSDTPHAWLFPSSPLGAFLMILPLAILHTGFVILHWLPAHPKALLYSPFIFSSKLAHAIGVFDGVKAKMLAEFERKKIKVS